MAGAIPQMQLQMWQVHTAAGVVIPLIMFPNAP